MDRQWIEADGVRPFTREHVRLASAAATVALNRRAELVAAEIEATQARISGIRGKTRRTLEEVRSVRLQLIAQATTSIQSYESRLKMLSLTRTLGPESERLRKHLEAMLHALVVQRQAIESDMNNEGMVASDFEYRLRSLEVVTAALRGEMQGLIIERVLWQTEYRVRAYLARYRGKD